MASDLPTGLGWTALLVAGARARESARSDRLFHDPLAQRFVTAARQISPDAADLDTAGSPRSDVDRWRADSVAVRTRFFDDCLGQACASGCRQVVLLAAGLDTRAFRLAWPDGVRLFEIDLPDVFAFKERVLAECMAKPACERTVVPADLREDWPAALRAAGFRRESLTAWLAEGLLMYLSEPERDQLFDRMGEVSSAGSRLALDHRAGFFAVPSLPIDSEGRASPARLARLAASSQADLSLIEPAAWLAGHGWQASVHAPAELSGRYARPVPPPLQAESPGSAHSWLATAEHF